MLRSLDCESGQQIHLRIDRGHFAPDDFVLDMVGKRLAEPDCRDGYLLDGFPRTLVQAKAFDEQLADDGQRIDHVIHLIVQTDELVRRIRERGVLEKRPDDSAEIIRERLEIYTERTAPLLSYYQRQQIVREVDGMQGAQSTFEAICRLVLSPNLYVGSVPDRLS